MIIRLHNTLTKDKREFQPINPSNIRMYVCGPTVYGNPHIGNARAVVVYDILYRLLRYIYGEDQVTYVRNITDVDDKINEAAKERKISIQVLTDEVTEVFHRNMKSLNCLSPDIEPKATNHIKEMVQIIENLLAKDIAYLAPNNHIYFNVAKCEDYGKLAGREIEELRAGARVEVDKNKLNPEDFVLWKPAEEGDEESSIFDSPWVRGRPGWHIECSAMSSRYLGNDFDIHGGGADLMFPHHTNEIAQSCSAFPNTRFARYWVHNGFVTVNGEKMSKSLGNFTTVEDLLKQNISGEVIRYILLSTNYRKPLDWNSKNILDAKKVLNLIYKVISDEEFAKILPLEDEEILAALADDLNTPKAFAHFIDIAKRISKASEQDERSLLLGKLKFAGNLLGFFQSLNRDWFEREEEIVSVDVEQKLQLRQEARKAKNWDLSDRIRDELKSLGIIVEDNSDGSFIVKYIR